MTAMNSEMMIANKIVFDATAFEQFRLYTELHGKNEWGGVCIGYQDGDVFFVRGVVLPPQKQQSMGYCEFKKEIFPIITKRLIKLQDEHQGFFNYRIGVWIHTHPGLGVFFSGTDYSNFDYLTKMSPDFLAVVVDPLSNQVIGYHGKKETRTIKKKKKEEKEETDDLPADDVPEPETTQHEVFSEIEIVLEDFEVENFDEEQAFLNDFKRVVASEQAAQELGEDSLIDVFIPLEHKDFMISILQIRVKYLEGRLNYIERSPEFTENMSELHEQLVDLVFRSMGAAAADVIVPDLLMIRKKGLIYGEQDGSNFVSRIIPWDRIEKFEINILAQGQTESYKIVSHLLLDLTSKKKGFFSKPETFRIYLYTFQASKLIHVLMEYYSEFTVKASKPKREEVEEKEQEDVAEDDMDDTMTSDKFDDDTSSDDELDDTDEIVEDELEED